MTTARQYSEQQQAVDRGYEVEVVREARYAHLLRAQNVHGGACGCLHHAARRTKDLRSAAGLTCSE
jgi:hypothetical protein